MLWDGKLKSAQTKAGGHSRDDDVWREGRLGNRTEHRRQSRNAHQAIRRVDVPYPTAPEEKPDHDTGNKRDGLPHQSLTPPGAPADEKIKVAAPLPQLGKVLRSHLVV